MNHPERKFWNELKKHLPGTTSRIENEVDSGDPDVSGAYDGQDYWIELKYCSNKSKEKNIYKLLRPSQIAWHARRAKQGSLILTIVRYEVMIVVYKAIGLEQEKIMTFYKENNKWQWSHIESTIAEIIEMHGGF